MLGMGDAQMTLMGFSASWKSQCGGEERLQSNYKAVYTVAEVRAKLYGSTKCSGTHMNPIHSGIIVNQKMGMSGRTE